MAAKSAFTTDSKIEPNQFTEVDHGDDVQIDISEKATGTTGLRYWVERLAVETGGIERVTDEDRVKHTSKVWNSCTFWYVQLGLIAIVS
jgi:hypothetical protein